MWLRVLALALVVLGACRCAGRVGRDGRDDSPPAPAGTQSTAQGDRGGAARVIDMGPLRAPEAFDLVTTSEGAVLVWSAPLACDQALRAQRVSATGAALGEPSRLVDACAAAPELAPATSRIREVVAAAGGGRLGVAWIVEDEAHAVAFGTFGSDDASAFASARRFRDVERAYDVPRSRLTLVASEGAQMRTAVRAPVGPCVAQAGRCSHMVSFSHLEPRAAAERGTDTREVEHPCPGLMSGALWVRGVWFDAFCVRDRDKAEQPVTQVYAIRPETYYAEVSPALAGCTPLGLAPAATSALLFAQCHDGLAVQSVVSERRPPELRTVTRLARCEEGHPLFIVQGQAHGTLETATSASASTDQGSSSESTEAQPGAVHMSVALDGPRDRIELLLPPELAPPGSRAVYTGRRVLVAYPSAGVLQLATLVCHGDALVPDIGVML